MENFLSEAERWEEGCKSDQVRNNFVVPHLVRLLRGFDAKSILDIGAGTGYIAREVDKLLFNRPQWTLLDANAQRLQLAVDLAPANMLLETRPANIFTAQFSVPFDVIIATFTLLEITELDRLIGMMPALVRPGGLLLIGQPDAWVDVVDASEQDLASARAFLVGAVDLRKIDKFTGEPYPFRAVRIEHLISVILASGFELVELNEWESGAKGVYVLAFRRWECPR